MIKDFKDYHLLKDKTYILDEDLEWHIGKYPSKFILTIKKDFEFDISVPRVFEWFLDPHNPKILLASAVHDHFIQEGFDESFCTNEFKRAAIASGSNKFYILIISHAMHIYRLLSKRFTFIRKLLFNDV